MLISTSIITCVEEIMLINTSIITRVEDILLISTSMNTYGEDILCYSVPESLHVWRTYYVIQYQNHYT